MSTSNALHFIGGPGPARDLCVSMGEGTRVFQAVADFVAERDKVPGLVVLAPTEAVEALTLAEELWETGEGWTLALADGGEPPTLRTVSVGLRSGPGDIATYIGAEVGRKAALVDLREALTQIAKVRHDVNNPLTAAMAEIQILLMDAEHDADAREALVVVQEQLRRIRDLLADTRHLRTPQR